MSNKFYPNAGHHYSTHTMPVEVDCSFKVAATDSGGLGITGLKGNGILNVFMHTTQTPGVSNGVTNPNPASGTILIQLADNYTTLYHMDYTLVSPNGTPVLIDASDALLTAGIAYTITTVGDATLANWQTIGLPKGLTPTVGMSFIAKATGAGISATSAVAPSAAAGSAVFQLELVGQSSLMLGPTPGQGGLPQVIIQSRKDSASDASTIGAIADATVVNIKLSLGNSSANTSIESSI